MILKKTITFLLTLLIGFIFPVLAGEIHKAAKDGDFETVKKLLEPYQNQTRTLEPSI